MDTTDRNCSAVTVANGAYPVRCTEEVLLPLFTDESLQAAMDSQHPPASHSVPPALPELRLVLLGRKGAGKSAAGNTILGGVGGFESGKPTEECVKRRADVAGRKVTVVDTPGWEWYYPLNSTPNWVRRETLRSVSLCPPGPHAVLLVMRSCASVTDDYIREIEEHLETLGKEVWKHTMVLFTRGDELSRGSMEQRVLTSGPALQRLLQKCGNRYHVVNNMSKGDGTQVKELMGKLEEMVHWTKEGNDHLEMDSTVLLGLKADGKRRARERRKKQRQMEAQMQRGTLKAALMSDGPQGSELDAHRSFSKAPRRLPEVRLVLLGERETGKSSAGNAILGKTVFFQAGAVTEECIRQQAEVARWLVTVVDTPGWEAGVAGATPERVKREIVCSVALCPPGPHALLLTLRVDTLVRAEHVRQHLELLGEGVWRHIILLFTHGDQLREGVAIEQHIQGGGRDLQWLLEKCRGRYHVISSIDGGGRGSGASTEVAELLEKVEKMATVNRCEAFSSLVHEVRDLSRQRNEKFNQRLKEMGDKMLRQEAELTNLREREMKRIKWFIKKPKSPGKAEFQRDEEEDEDRRVGERKNDIGELEDRMRWLTEDKEREIQDLNLENERIRLALNQSRGERDEVMLNLELKEREIEELKERSDEQQLKLLDLERATEHERKQREDDIRAKKQEWRKEFEKLEDTTALLRRDKAEWMDKLDSLKVEMDQANADYGEALERKAQEMAEMEQQLKREMEVKLLDKDKQQEELRKKASEEKQTTLGNIRQHEKDMESKFEDMKSQHEKAMGVKIQEKVEELKLQHQEEMARKISEMEAMKVQQQQDTDKKSKAQADDMDRIQQQHDDEIRGIQRENRRQMADLKEQFAKENKEHMQVKKRERAELEQKFLSQMEEIRQENAEEKEAICLNHKKDMERHVQGKDKEVEALKWQHQEEMAVQMNEMATLTEARRAEHQEEIDRIVKQKEEDVERVQRRHTEKLQQLEQERQRDTKELKQQLAREIEEQLQERQRQIRNAEEKHAARIEEITLEHTKEKEALRENHEKHILQKLQERDRLRDGVEESEKEKYKREMEQKVEEMKLRVKEMKEIMQLKDQNLKDMLNNREAVEQQLKETEKDVEEMKEELRRNEETESERLSHHRDVEQKLEEREREAEVMKEHLTELGQQLLQTEEERERDDSRHKQQTEQALEERDRVIEKLQQHIRDVAETLQRKEEERGAVIVILKKEAEQRLHDSEREMEEVKRQLLSDMERKLKEKEAEIERVTQQAEEQKKKEEEGANEMNELAEILNKKTEEVTRAQSLLAQRDSEIDEAKSICANYLKDMAELKESNERQQRHAEQERKKEAQTTDELQRKEEELDRLRQRDRDNEGEIVQLRLTIEQTKSELKALVSRMEKEMTSMIQEYEKEIARKNEDIESTAKQRDDAVSRLEEDSRRRIRAVTEKYEESQRRVEELQERDEKMRKETDNLKTKCEEEVGKHLRACEEQVKSVEAESQTILRERDLEVKALKEANEILQAEVEGLKEKEGEAKQLKEDNSEQRRRDEEAFLKREKEVEEREQALRRHEEELSKRGSDLDAKQEELVEEEVKWESKERELRELEERLEMRQKEQEDQDQHEQDVKLRAQNVKKMERELESLLKALEGKQKELSSHGQDLQKKVRGLKDQGKQLKDREYYLKNEEQELLNWKSELQVQNKQVHCTTQQLDEMGRDLALLKGELHSKESNLKVSLNKLSQWEENLTQREEELRKREQRESENGQHGTDSNVDGRDPFHLAAAVETSEDTLSLMYQEVSESREKGRGKESDRDESAKDREDQRTKTALSAAERNNCHLETLKEMLEGKEGTRRGGTREKNVRQEVESAKVIREFKLPSQSRRRSSKKDFPGSDLRVVFLGETWSSRSPAGVTMLGGEASKFDGSAFRPWRGEIAGRRLAVAEPLGLRWRDGPDPSNTSQLKGLLDSISWCHPGPHIVLLLMPTFLTCTPKYRRAVEEHMSLLGEETWRRTLVLFTWGEILGESAEQHILRNGELMGLVERCGGRYHVLTSKKNNSVIEGLFEKIEDIVALNSVEL